MTLAQFSWRVELTSTPCASYKGSVPVWLNVDDQGKKLLKDDGRYWCADTNTSYSYIRSPIIIIIFPEFWFFSAPMV